jgi:hypothetical protein
MARLADRPAGRRDLIALIASRPTEAINGALSTSRGNLGSS